MKQTFFYVVLLAVSLTLSSCSSCNSINSKAINGLWQVTSIKGENITPAENTPNIGFDAANKKIYGYTGCNRIMGEYIPAKLKKGFIDLSSLGCTRMFCHEDKYESNFLKSLSEVKRISVVGNKMELKNKLDITIVELEKK